MIVTIRPESMHTPQLLQMLQHVTTQMLTCLRADGITLADNSVKIWVKRHGRTGNLYPKIEFDAHGEELQYGLDEHGTVKEAHFKSFDKSTGRLLRADIEPDKACELLQQIHASLFPNGIDT